MTKEEFKKHFTEEDAVGWQFIDDKLKSVYGEKAPRHYGPLCGLHYVAGGTDPIDGASIYDSEKGSFHRHIVSFGMSELYYNEDNLGKDYSKWGFEFTFRIAPFEGDKGDPLWAVQIMNNLARYVFKSGNWFEENHFVPAGGPIRIETDTEITGLIFTVDPELEKMYTPYGEITFLQMVGITQKEVDALGATPTLGQVEDLIAELKKNNPYLITDLNRK